MKSVMLARVGNAESGKLSICKIRTDTKLRLMLLDDVSVNAVPLPTALPLFASGVALLGFLGWRRKRKAIAA